MKTSTARKLLIVGNGYLGGAVVHHFSPLYQTVVLDYPAIDITNLQSIEQAIAKYQPDIVINAAGYTNVDGAEKPENQPAAFALNVQGAINLGYTGAKHHFYLVHISTGMMFDTDGHNTKKFSENDTPNPIGYYAWTKAWGDAGLESLMQNASILITRIHLPVSRARHSKSLLTKMITYDKGLSSQASVTIVEDYVRALEQMLQKRVTGIVNVVNPGTISFLQMMEMLQHHELIPTHKKLESMTRKEMNAMTDKAGGARRPDSILSTDKLQSLGITLPHIHQAIEQAVIVIANSHESTSD